MKVLHVIPSLSASSGGPSKALQLMEQVLAGQGVLIDTASTNDDGPGRHNGKRLGVPLAENGVTRRYFNKLLDFYKVSPRFALWALRNVRSYDVVHIHALFSFTSIAAAWAARRAGVPYVMRPLGTLTGYGVTQRRPLLKRLSIALFERRALRHAAAVHFTSEEERHEAQQWQLPMHGVVIPLGIEPSEPFTPGLLRERLPLIGEHRYLLFLSRLDPKKNVEALLEAFSLCAARLPDLRLVIAGDGDAAYVAILKALSKQHPGPLRIIWAGHVEGALKASLLAGAEAFVLPSYSENFGIAAAEALMAGKPCILGTGVAIAHDVARAGAGLAVSPDPTSIADAILQIALDHELRTAMSARAAAFAAQQYSSATMGAKLFALYSGIIRDARASPAAANGEKL